MHFKKVLAPFVLGSLLTASALAEESMMTFGIESTVLKYNTGSSEFKSKTEGVEKVKSNNSSLSTVPLGDTFVNFALGKAYLYLYPLTDAKLFSLGYQVNDSIEVGLNLGLNNMSMSKPKASGTNNWTGLYGVYYLPVAANTVEILAGFDSQTVTTKSTDATTNASVTTVNDSMMSYNFGAQIVVPLAKNYQYVGGFKYIMSTKDAKADGDTKGKTTMGDLALKVLAVRCQL